MNVTYVDLHIHTSENADELVENYNVDKLIERLKEESNNKEILISLTDHNVINIDAYMKLKEKNEINLIVGVELHIRNHDNRPAYHCHIYFDIDEINETKLEEINKILGELYPKKMVERKDKSIPKIEKVINSFEKYDFVLIPHGGQNHATFEQSINPSLTCDETIERTIYYNQIEGFSARSNKGLEATREYLKKLGIGSFVNLITGSDNYIPEKYPQPKTDEASEFVPTWMYASPNFNGLKLALSEDSRLEYAATPTLKDYHIIKKVRLKNEKVDIDVDLTQGLNVVIGESSSGKTLFVDSIIKKIRNEKDSNYEDNFFVSNVEIDNEIGSEPYYIEQNFITGAVKDNKDLNNIPIIKELFPESEYKQDIIDKELSNVKSIINSLIKSVKKVEEAEEKIKKVPSIYNLIITGGVETNVIDLFYIGDDLKEKIEYSSQEAMQDIKQIRDIKSKLQNNKLYDGNILIFNDVIKEIEYLRDKFKFSEKIRKIIEKNKKEYDKKINQSNNANTTIIKHRNNLIGAIGSYIEGNKIFNEKLEELSKINLEVQTINREYENNKLYIKNNLKISKDTLKDILFNYIKIKKDKKFEELVPSDFYSKNFQVSKVKNYDELNKRLYNDIIEKNKKIYKIIDYNGKDFDNLSPGWKTAVILDIMLKYDEDNAPLIIDQPEDNLANTYINQDLISGIKYAKKNKQIIMVSHNATIPMLGDAQNIILCRNINDKIVIRSASLEDKIDGKLVIDYIAEITDGGKKAIKKRFKKYNFKKYRED